MQLISCLKRSEQHVTFFITSWHVFLRKQVKFNEKRQVNIFSSLSTIIKVVTCIFSYFFEQMRETGNLGAREVQSKLGVKYINPICITRARSCRVLLYLIHIGWNWVPEELWLPPIAKWSSICKHTVPFITVQYHRGRRPLLSIATWQLTSVRLSSYCPSVGIP